MSYIRLKLLTSFLDKFDEEEDVKYLEEGIRNFACLYFESPGKAYKEFKAGYESNKSIEEIYEKGTLFEAAGKYFDGEDLSEIDFTFSDEIKTETKYSLSRMGLALGGLMPYEVQEELDEKIEGYDPFFAIKMSNRLLFGTGAGLSAFYSAKYLPELADKSASTAGWYAGLSLISLTGGLFTKIIDDFSREVITDRTGRATWFLDEFNDLVKTTEIKKSGFAGFEILWLLGKKGKNATKSLGKSALSGINNFLEGKQNKI